MSEYQYGSPLANQNKSTEGINFEIFFREADEIFSSILPNGAAPHLQIRRYFFKRKWRTGRTYPLKFDPWNPGFWCALLETGPVSLVTSAE
jgi:hypothetical protein